MCNRMKGVALPTSRTRPALLLLPLLLLGCGGAQTGDGAAAAGGSLTGLYEGGSGPGRNQLCLIEREGRAASFGFIVWGEENRNCSASGLARRQGDRLRLLPDGDESCALEARLDGDRILLPETVTPECARYYCGAGAAMTKAEFSRSGESEADARRATDLVGAPLCGG
jgi:hypothetical protein